MIRIRLYILSGFFVGIFALILFRSFQLQLLPHEKIEALARRQSSQKIEIAGRRGPISDREGRILAVSVNSQSLFAHPHQIANPQKTARALARKLGLSERHILNRLKENPEKRFVWLSRQLSNRQLQNLSKMNLKNYPGIGVVQEYRREYPRETLASHILGFVSLDGKGLEGIEKKFDAQLQGEASELSFKRDAKGRALFLSSEKRDSLSHAGQSVELSIDANLQASTERALARSVAKFSANGGIAIVMEPNSGEILAMAVSPGFNPNEAGKFAAEQRRNRSITDPIEPGSVVKPLVVAKAIEDKIVTEKSLINAGQGFVRVGRKTIGEADAKHRFDRVSIADLIRVSSNVGTVFLQQKMGFEKVEEIFLRLGFNKSTGLEVPGESRGLFKPVGRNQLLEQATMSFGQGFAITPMQIIKAYAPLANGGFNIQPRLVKNAPLAEGGVPDRVFSESTVVAMRKILERVVQDEGTGVQAKVENFSVAGKTGTSQKVDFKNGGYKSGAYWSSFVGFLPSQKPRFLIYTMIDEARGLEYYGGQVAAPLFSEIARDALRLIPEKRTPPKAQAGVQLAKKNKKVLPEARPPLMEKDGPESLQELPLRQALRKLEGHKARVEILNVGTKVDTAEYIYDKNSELTKVRLRLR